MEITFLVASFIASMIIGLPIAFCLGSASLLTIIFFHGFNTLQNIAVPVMFNGIESFVLVAVPLFLLMGLIMQRGGISEILYSCASVWLRHIAGGLGLATTLSCAIFAAISGSSPATTATIGSISIPSMLKRGYERKFTFGLIAAGGTLGILIPPSISMVVYGAITGDSVGKLFLAGFVPGILLALILAIYTYLISKKKRIPTDHRANWRERVKATRKALWSIFMPVFILGGIYAGVFTPTEAAAVGVFYALFLGLFVYRTLRWVDLPDIVMETVRISCMIFAIIICALLFSHLIILMRIPHAIAQFVALEQVPAWVFWLFIIVLVNIEGCFLDAAAILYITVPTFFPVLEVLRINSIHFGIIMVMLIELGMITPPVGMNLFVIMGLQPGVRISEIVKGAWPFMVLIQAFIIVVIVLPILALWIPGFMR